MVVVIEDDYLKDLYVGEPVKGKPRFGQEIIRGFKKCVLKMKNAKNSNDLRANKSLHLEKLSGNLLGKYSVRINNAYRIIFRMETEGGQERIEIIYVESISNHYS